MKYIILELIPTSLDPNKGDIIQLSALKIEDLKLIDRFDYRIVDEKVPLDSMLDMISYDKDKFIYKNTTNEILDAFDMWSEDIDLLIIDNAYTEKYLKKINNKKESIFNHLDLKYSDDIIDIIMKKYNLVPSNYIVDLLYEISKSLCFRQWHIDVL